MPNELRPEPAPGAYAARWAPLALDEAAAVLVAGGRDPDAELIAARLNGWDPARWAAAVLAGAGADPGEELGDSELVELIATSGNPAAWHAAISSTAGWPLQWELICRAPPVGVLEALLDHEEENVRAGVVRSHGGRMAEAQLVYCCHDPDANVRFAAGQNGRHLPAVAEALASDPNYQVRHMLAASPATPVHVLRRLADDPVEFPREAARMTLRNLEREERLRG